MALSWFHTHSQGSKPPSAIAQVNSQQTLSARRKQDPVRGKSFIVECGDWCVSIRFLWGFDLYSIWPEIIVGLDPKTDVGVPLAAENWTQKDRGKMELRAKKIEFYKDW